jgi:hypothetical protein
MNEPVPFNLGGYVFTIQSHEVPEGGWVVTVDVGQMEAGKAIRPKLFL